LRQSFFDREGPSLLFHFHLLIVRLRALIPETLEFWQPVHVRLDSTTPSLSH
jgi:hypothetical protein